MKFTKEEKFIAKMVIIVVIGLLVRQYGLYIQNKTIESAKLYSVNQNTHTEYTIEFDGEYHNYTGDWYEEYQSTKDYLK